MKITKDYNIVPFQYGGLGYPSFEEYYADPYNRYGLTIQNHPQLVTSWLEFLYLYEVDWTYCPDYDHCPIMRQVDNNYAYVFGNETRVDQMRSKPDIRRVPNNTKVDTWEWGFIPLERRSLPFSPTGYDQPITLFYSFKGERNTFQVSITAIFSSYGKEIVTTTIWNLKDFNFLPFNKELINTDQSLLSDPGKVWRNQRFSRYD